MKIYLRDSSKELASAWKQFFDKEEDVEVSYGDIWGRTADAIVSPAQSFGFMDGGIDYVYSERFGPKMQKDLQKLINENYYGELPVGQAAIVPLIDIDYHWLVSAPTMRVPLDVHETANAYLAFRAALIAVLEHNKNHETKINSLLCPGLGTGIGRIPSIYCARQMYLAYRMVIKGDRLNFSTIGAAYVAHKMITHSS
jgi:O-acetyl-ADP-ribose deacetylase (regulator of RNase III)